MFRSFLAGLILMAMPAAADPTGIYKMTGIETGTGTAYAGTVTVSRISEKYVVVWKVGNREVHGVALGGAFSEGSFMIGPAHPDDLMLAIGFSDGSAFGAATMFLQQDGSYEGFRVSSTGAKAGQERWVPAE